MERTTRYLPKAMGDVGRRARVIFLEDAVEIDATDASAGGYAMAIVLEALSKTQREVDRYRILCRDLLEDLPEVPDWLHALHSSRAGLVHETDVLERDYAEAPVVGLGYVLPDGAGYECGAVLFDQATYQARYLRPHHLAWIDGGIRSVFRD